MKKTLLFFAVLALTHSVFAQWSPSGNNIYNSNSGNVGIGISNPTFGVLQINGSGDLLSFSSIAPTSPVQINAYNTNDFRMIQRTNGIMTLWTNTIERLRIDQNGRVGIGTPVTPERLVLRDPDIPFNASTGIVKILFDSGNGGGGAIGFEKETFNTGGLRFFSQYGYGSTSEKMRISGEGNVGIGTTTPDSKLTVNGTVHSKSVVVDMNIFADYVFHPKYVLPTLSDVDAYVKKYRHLPEIPSEKEVVEKGLDVGEMNKLLVKKVEELTLYVIIAERKNNAQQLKLTAYDRRLKTLEAKLNSLASKSK